jgi:hypothetical protein
MNSVSKIAVNIIQLLTQILLLNKYLYYPLIFINHYVTVIRLHTYIATRHSKHYYFGTPSNMPS